MKELYQILGVKLAATTAYHPQGDGQTEQINQELEQFLWLFINQWQYDWDDLLPFAEFQYNNHVHSTTQNIPFLLDTGWIPHMGFEPDQWQSHVESINEFKKRMEEVLKEAKAALVKSKDDMAKYYNRRRTPAPDYQSRDKVYLDASDIQTTRTSQKLSHWRLGLFTIVRKVRNGAYCLHLPPSMSRLHLVVRGHLHSLIPLMEYVYLDIPDTLHLSNSPYIPPHQWQIPFPSDSFICISICPNSKT